MTGRFETLIYTDCRAGQGLRGGPGLQFQAKSAGVAVADMDVVQRELLYEAPSGWINERRPIEDYPPSLAHVWDQGTAVLATAQGAYLGREAKGMREGNQITHAIATTDPDAYGLVRPAQLLNAPFWTTEPAPTTDCPVLEAGWQPGPSEPAAIRDFVAAQADGHGLLVTLLSALGRVGEPNAARVLFVADRPEQVIQWIAAATLLQPQRRALAVGFKVFTANPSYCQLPVVAVHPDWAGPYRSVDSASGFVVLDLLDRRHTPIEADEQAKLWAELFLDADPYDVMDAVELADTIAAAGAAPAQACAVAVAAMFGRAPRARDVPEAVSWIARGAPDLVGEHGEAVAQSLLGKVAGGDLRLLDDAVALGRVPAAACAIRTALLRDELASAARTGNAPEDQLPRLPAPAVTAADRGAWVATALGAIESAPDESVDAVLRVARRHRLDLPISGFADRVRRFVTWWAGHPELPYDPARWPCEPEIIDALRDELTGRLTEPAETIMETVAAVRKYWWPLLLESSREPFHALDAEVMAGVMDAAEPAVCERFVRKSVSYAAGLPDATDAVGQACKNLWFARNPTVAEALAALRLIPSDMPVPRALLDTLADAFDAGWSPTDVADVADGLDAAAALADRGVKVPDPWRTLHLADRRLRDTCDALPAATGRQQQDLLKKMCAVAEEVLAARADRIGDALAQYADPDFVVRVLGELPRRVGPALVTSLARDRAGRPEITAGREFALLASRRLPKRLKETLATDLRNRLANDEANLDDAVRVLLGHQSTALRTAWDVWVANGRRDLP